MLSYFEKLLHPYPQARPKHPPDGFFPFFWARTEGSRPLIVAMTLLTAAIGAFEALLFSMLGQIVGWLSKVEPARL